MVSIAWRFFVSMHRDGVLVAIGDVEPAIRPQFQVVRVVPVGMVAMVLPAAVSITETESLLQLLT